MRVIRRVLVVDDNVAVARAIARLLELSGYVVDVADTFHLARSLDEETHYVVVIADVYMPDGGAVELAAVSRAPVVAMTGDFNWTPPAGSRVRAVLEKPFPRALLEEVLDAMTAR